MISVKEDYKEYMQSTFGVESYNLFKRILYGSDDTLISNVFQNYVSQLNVKKNISICDIGGGDGRRIISLCNLVNQKFDSKINLDFIEQSSIMCEMFEKMSQNILDFTEINIFSCKMEDAKIKSEYDLMFFVHSIFCLQSFDAFLKYYQCLKRDGIIIIASNAPDSFLANIKKDLDIDYIDKRYEINYLIDELDAANISYEQSYFETRWLIEANELHNKIHTILNWLSLGRFAGFDKKRQNYITEKLLSLGIKHNEDYLFSETEQIIIIENKEI
ncbi:MAG: hypothetical protein AB3N18_13310 [Allomuricauda sp.]